MDVGEGEDQGLVDQSVGTDAALFDGAIADEVPKEEPAAAEPEKAAPADEGQPRTPDGKFASKEPEKSEPQTVATAADKPAETTEKEKDGWIPAWRVRQMKEEGEQRAAAEASELRRRIAQLEKPAETKKQEIPDPLLDYEGYHRTLIEQFRSELRAERGNLSLRSARKSDPETFDKAYAAAAEAIARGDRLTQQRIGNSDDPGEELIAWHKENETRREVGNDPNAYVQRKLDEALKDPAFLAKAIEAAKAAANGTASTSQTNGGTRPVVKLPPSLTGAARADAASGTEDGDLMSDGALFTQALSPSR